MTCSFACLSIAQARSWQWRVHVPRGLSLVYGTHIVDMLVLDGFALGGDAGNVWRQGDDTPPRLKI